jgi:subtilase family serine protease/flagellar hook assembly protein FlgD
MKVLMRCLSAVLLFCAWLTCNAQPVGSETLELQHCVETISVKNGRALTAPKTPLTSTDMGQVWVADFPDAYDRDDEAARQQVAQTFYQNRADEYDFLITFTTFDFATGEALAFYNSIKNDIEGIGQERFDYSARFGSQGRLQGYVDMAALSRWELNSANPGFDRTLDALAHELMHRWGSSVHFLNSSGQVSDALLGRDRQHWSYFLNSQASVMYGSRWAQRADGRFESVDTYRGYSDLDLYLAGFKTASEVGSLELIQSTSGNRDAIPERGALISGALQAIPLAQVIAHEGARRPSAEQSPKMFRAGLVLLRRPGESISPIVLAQLEQLRIAFQQRFSELTQGRALLRIENRIATPVRVGEPQLVTGQSSPYPASGQAGAIAWLRAQQKTNGSFADKPGTEYRDTALAVLALSVLDPEFSGLPRARSWLTAHATSAVDDQSWRILVAATSDRSGLLDAQNSDGSLGYVRGWQGSPLDTVQGLYALRLRGDDLVQQNSASVYLANTQTRLGGFAPVHNGRPTVTQTLLSINELEQRRNTAFSGNVQRARSWLSSKQFAGGGLGDVESNVTDSALALSLQNALQLPALSLAELRRYVQTTQHHEGDWAGSVYATATALLALAQDGRPNLTFSQAMTISPDRPSDGDVVQVEARIRNTGQIAAPATRARWFEGESMAAAVPIGDAFTVSELAPGALLSLPLVWSSIDKSGPRTLWLRLDVDQTLTELSEVDNDASVSFTVAASSSQAELRFDPDSVSVNPAIIDRVPATSVVRASVRNVGLTAANQVRVRVSAQQGDARVTLAESTVDVPSRSVVNVVLPVSIETATLRDFQIDIDPDQRIAEAREDNNRQALNLRIASAIDLEVLPSDITRVATSSLAVGADARFQIRIRNRGTVDAPSSDVRVDVVQGTQRYPLGVVSVQVSAGAVVERELVWRVAALEPARVEVTVDPANAITETDESNNVARFDFSPQASTQANLIMVSGSASALPNPALEGQALAVQVRVRNAGSVAATAFDVAIYDEDPRVGGHRLGSARVASGVAALAEQVVDVRIVSNPLRGNRILHVVADDGQAVAESNENDNLILLPLETLSIPDLLVRQTGIRLIPALPVVGENVEAQVTVFNSGGQAASNVRVRLEEGVDAGAIVTLPELTIPSVPAGGSTQIVFRWRFGVSTNPRGLMITVNPQQTIAEVSTENNRVVVPVDTQNGNLFVSERYISPNGDGVQDESAVVFRVDSGHQARAVIENAIGHAVRQWSTDLAIDNGRGRFVWDGRDDRSIIVSDGDYRLRIIRDDDQVLGTSLLTVDTNQSSPLEAIGTPRQTLLRLPTDSVQWKVPPSVSPMRDYLFGMANGGIARIHSLFGDQQPVISRAWLAQLRSSLGVFAVEVSSFAFSRDGRKMLVLIDTGVENATALYQINLDQTDIPSLVVSGLPRFVHQLHELTDTEWVLSSGYSYGLASTRLIRLDARTATPYRADFGELAGRSEAKVLWVNTNGAVVGSVNEDTESAAYRYRYPYAFVPKNPALPQVALVDATRLQTITVEPSADGRQFLLHAYQSEPARSEIIALVEVATGQVQVLHQHQIRSSDLVPPISGRDAGYVFGEIREIHQLRAAWVAADQAIVVLDAANRQLLNYTRTGQRLGRAELPGPVRQGAYATTEYSPVINAVVAAVRDSVGTTGGGWYARADGLCNQDMDWHDRNNRGHFYDARDQSVWLSVVEGVFAYDPSAYRYNRTREEGIIEYHQVKLNDFTAERRSAVTGWPLATAIDRERFPYAGHCQQNRPSFWPRWILRDGSRLRWDQRFELASGRVSATQWNEWARVAGFWPDDTRILLDNDTREDRGKVRRVFGSLLNLEALLVASTEERSIRLAGTVVDRNFARYDIDWADASRPDSWNVLVAGAFDEVFNEDFIQFAPPRAGEFLFRLRAYDQAGNRIERFARAYAPDPGSPIANLTFEPRYLSPNGDGVKDSLLMRFEVTRAASVDFAIRNAQGQLVRSLTRVFASSNLGANEWRWDGRSDAGAVVADGVYQVQTAGWSFPVRVDTARPQVSGRMLDPYRYDPHLGAPIFEAEYSAQDSNPNQAVLEIAPESGGEWQALPGLLEWSLTAGQPAFLLRMPASYFVQQRLRVRATDLAGNSTVQVLGTGTKRLVIHSIGVHGLPPLSLQAEPFDTSASVSVGPTLDQDGNDRLRVLDAVGDLRQITLEAATFGGEPLAWRVLSTIPITSNTCSGTECETVQPLSYSLRMALADVPASTRMRFRLRGQRADGTWIVSNQFDATIGGWIIPACNASNSVRITELLAGSLSNAQMVLTLNDGRVQRITAARIDERTFEFLLPVGARGSYVIEGTDERGRLQRSPLGSVGCGISGGPAPHQLLVSPLVASSCSDIPSAQIRVGIQIPPGDSLNGLLRVCYEHPVSRVRTCPIEEAAPVVTGTAWVRAAIVDTEGWPEGEVALTLERRSGDVWQSVGSASMPIDRQVPQVNLESPADGARLCATPRLPILGSVRDNYSMAWQAEFVPDDTRVLPSLLAERGRVLNTDRPSEFVLSGFDGRSTLGELLAKPAAMPNAVLPHGPGQLRLSAIDWSGAQVCRERRVTFDGRVEIEESRQLPGLVNASSIGIAPRGAREFQQTHIYLRPREPLSIEVRATPRVLGSLTRDPERAGSVVQRIARTVAGTEIEINWNGQIDGRLVADGEYELWVIATDDCGQRVRLPYIVVVDDTPPALNIDDPQRDALLEGISVQVNGRINDTHFAAWELNVGLGAVPTEWSLLARGNQVIGSIAPLAVWQRPRDPATQAVLQLTASDRLGNTSQLQVPVRLNRLLDLIGAASVTPSIISPNQDGAHDGLRVQYTMQQSATLGIRVLDDRSLLVTTLIPSALVAPGTRSVLWDGRRADGTIAPDGNYQIELNAFETARPSVNDRVLLSAVVDTVAPALSVVQPSGDYARAEDSVRVALSEPHLDQANIRLRRVSDNAVVSEVQPQSPGIHILAELAGQSEGLYRIEIEALDVAGNRSQVQREFTLDKTAPRVVLTAPVSESVVRGETVVAWHGTAQDSHFASWQIELAALGVDPPRWTEIRRGTVPIDAASFGRWTASLSEGDYRVRLSATDLAGNRSEALSLISIDTTAPEAAITLPLENAFVGRALNVVGTAFDRYIQRYQVSIANPSQAENGIWNELNAGTSSVRDGSLADLALAAVDGLYRLRLQVTDRSGQSTSVTRPIQIDTAAPTSPLNLRAQIVDNRDARLEWNASLSTDVAHYRVLRNGAAIHDTDASTLRWLDANAPEGILRYQVVAVDTPGNVSPPSNTVELALDKTAPDVELLSPVHEERVRGRIDIQGTAWSTDDFREYRLSVQPLTPAGPAVLLTQSSAPRLQQVLGSWSTVGVAEDARVRVRLEAEDRSGNVASRQVDLVVDNAAPAVPTGLQASAEAAAARVRWNANSEPDLLGYLLYRNGALVNQQGSPNIDLRVYAIPAITHLDSGVGDGRNEYRLRAIDRAGNISAFSAPVSYEREQGAPRLSITSPNDGFAFEDQVTVIAESTDLDIAQVQFAYRRYPTGAWSNLGVPVTTRPYRLVWTPAALPYASYDIRAIATDLGGRVDTAPPQVTVRYDDLTPPPVVGNVRAQADGDTVRVSWDAVAVPDLSRYLVEWQSARYGDSSWYRLSELPAGTTHSDHTGLFDSDYLYRVTAIDNSGNRSVPTQAVLARVFSLSLEPTLTPIAAAQAEVRGSSLLPGRVEGEVLLGTASTTLAPSDTDAEGRFVLNTIPMSLGENEIRLRVRDSLGNRSRTVSAWVRRAHVPAAPEGLAAVVAGNRINLSWSANSETDLLGYRLFRNDAPVLADQSLARARITANYPFAVDGDSTTVWQPGGYFAPAADHSDYLDLQFDTPVVVAGINLQWRDARSAATDVDVHVWTGRDWLPWAVVRQATGDRAPIVFASPYRTQRIRIDIKRALATGYGSVALSEIDVVERPFIATNSFSETRTDGRYQYRVSAINQSAFESARSPLVNAEVGDIIAPDAPVLSGSLNVADVNLTWTASAATDVAQYELTRNGQVIATQAATAPRQYTDRRLANGSYRYTVVALDAFANRSTVSNSVSLDVQAAGPGAPTQLQVSVPNVGQRLDLSWQAGGGQVAVLYILRRALSATGPWVEVARTPLLQWSDVGLTNGTLYFYSVEARDAVGNASAPSATVSATPRDSQVPNSPIITHPTSALSPMLVDQSRASICGLSDPGVNVDLSLAGASVARVQAQASDTLSTLTTGLYQANVQVSYDARYALAQDESRRGGFVDLETGAVRTISVPVHALSPRLGYWYTVSEDGQLMRGLVQGSEISAVPGSAGAVGGNNRGLAFSYDAQKYFVARGTGSSRLTNLQTQESQLVSGIDASIVLAHQVSWSPDDRFVVVGTQLGTLHLLNTRTAEAQQIATQVQITMTPRWRTDGGYLLFAQHSGSTTLLREYNVETGITQTLYTAASVLSGADYSPDGREYAVLDSGIVHRFDRATQQATAQHTLTLPGATQLLWSTRQRMVAYGPGQLRVLNLAGSFCGNVDLREGDNRISAQAQHSNGNRSLPSAPITLTLRRAVALPELSIDPVSLRFLPAVGRIGEIYSVSFRVRNQGSARAESSRLALYLTAPDGTNRQVDMPAPVPALEPGASTALAVSLGVLAQAGNHALTIQVDADQRIDETDETNNQSTGSVAVLSGDQAQLEVVLNRSNYAPGERVQGDVGVMNAGSVFNGRIRLSIIDSEQVLVAPLADFSVSALASGQRVSMPWSWAPGSVLAGRYAVRAELLDMQDRVLVQQQATFTLQAVSHVRTSIQTETAQLTSGQLAQLNVSASYASGNTALNSTQLQLDAINAAGAVVWHWERALGTLLPGYAFAQNVDWSTAALAGGVYRLRLQLRSGDFTTQSETSIAVVDTLSSSGLIGSISVQPSGQVTLGRPASIQARVRNQGNAARNGNALRLRLLRTRDDASIAQREASVDLAAGAEHTMSLDLDALALELGSYRVQLEARAVTDAPDAYQLLAQGSVSVVDGLAPEVGIVSPAVDALLSLPARISARIVDQHSEIVSAQARIDNGEWLPLGLMGLGDYGRSVSALSEGVHRVVLRARDAWGNETQTSELRFEIDATAPVITITGVTEGERARRVVTPVVVVSDAHPQTQRITLNGVDWVSGTAISASGDYVLAVQAQDQAGNRAERTLRFSIDQTVPPLAFVSPLDGATFMRPSVDVDLQSEPGARVNLNVGVYRAEQIAEADGHARFLNVPLALANNRLEASAQDSAGNLAVPVSIQVQRVSDSTSPLQGDLQPSSTSVARGSELQFDLSVHNQSALARNAQELRLRVLNADASVLLSLSSWTRDIAAGDTYRNNVRIATSGWALGQVTAWLDMRDGDRWIALDVEALSIVDGEAPQLEALAPRAGDVLRAPLRLRARAIDIDSAVALVQASVDGEVPALTLSPVHVGGDVYESEALNLEDGDHSVVFEARDRQGNRVVLPGFVFSVDNRAPQIQIGGVTDGAIRNNVVTPTVDVVDAHPDQLLLQLNTAPYRLGTPISSDGDYVLDAEAIDRAGNRTRSTLRFSIDTQAPGLSIVAPVDGAIFNSDRVRVSGRTEALAQVRVSTTGFSITVSADAQGDFIASDVPLRIGSNTLLAQATDRAGNQGAEARVQVTRSATTAAQLEASLIPNPAVLRAGDALRLAYVLQNRSEAALRDVPIRIQVRATGVSVPLFDSRFNLNIERDARVSSEIAAVTSTWPSGTHLAVLEVQLNGTSWTELTSATLQVQDQAISLGFDAPAANSYHRERVELAVRVTGDVGRLRRVEATIDETSWVPLRASTGAPNLWSGSVSSTIEGSHRLRVRAFDQNEVEVPSAERVVIVDRTPPVLGLQGLPESDITNRPLRLSAEVSDAAPTTLILNLNAQAYTAESVVSVDGDYIFTALARDAAGNETTRSRSFTLDQIAPSVLINYPAPDAIVETDRTLVTGRSEANARIVLSLGSMQLETTSDALGDFRFVDLPLAVGVNNIAVRATDRAGNLGQVRNVSVTRRVTGAQALQGRLTLVSDRLRRGESLSVNAQLNNQGTERFTDLPVRLLVLRAQDGSTVLERTRTLNVAANNSVSFDEVFDSNSWAPGTLRLRLQAQVSTISGPAMVTLDERTFELTAALTLPLRIIAPLDGTVITQAQTDVVLETMPSTRVTLRIGARSLNAVADSAGRVRFSGVDLQVGSNTFSAQASNDAGEVSASVDWRVSRVDATHAQPIPVFSVFGWWLLLLGVLFGAWITRSRKEQHGGVA